MNTNDKTLADVQPGGRVRLGDGDEKPPQELPKLIVTRGDGIPLPDQAAGIEEFKRQCLRRIGAEFPHLSAQPSPGGQDALAALQQDYDKLLDSFNRQVEVAEKIAGRVLQQDDRIEELEEALAARQPVGEPVAWMTHHDEPMLFPTAAEAAAYCKEDEQPVPLFRSPAQAVDLGQFRDVVADWRDRCCRAADKNTIVNMAKADRLLALIDSQVVRNG